MVKAQVNPHSSGKERAEGKGSAMGSELISITGANVTGASIAGSGVGLATSVAKLALSFAGSVGATLSIQRASSKQLELAIESALVEFRNNSIHMLCMDVIRKIAELQRTIDQYLQDGDLGSVGYTLAMALLRQEAELLMANIRKIAAC